MCDLAHELFLGHPVDTSESEVSIRTRSVKNVPENVAFLGILFTCGTEKFAIRRCMRRYQRCSSKHCQSFIWVDKEL